MIRRIRTTILPAAAGLMLLCYAGGSGAQPILAIGPDAEVTEDGLHRVDPSIMEQAWVKPDLNLRRYTKILYMPAGVQFRDVRNQRYDPRTGSLVTVFPISDEMKALMREAWGQSFYEHLAEVESYEFYESVGRDVLMVQGFLIDVISSMPPDNRTGVFIRTVEGPWTVSAVLVLRDSMSNDILARTIDRQHTHGLIDPVQLPWVTRNMAESLSQLLGLRLEQLADLGGQ